MRRVNFVIGLIFLSCTSSFAQGSAQTFKNCVEAQKQSISDVKVGIPKYFTSGINRDIKSESVYQKRDSILRHQYGIEVITSETTDLHYTQMCYNLRIIAFFDSVYRRNVLLEALLVGEKQNE